MALAKLVEIQKPLRALMEFSDSWSLPIDRTFGDIARGSSDIQVLPVVDDGDEPSLRIIFKCTYGTGEFIISLKDAGCRISHGKWKGSPGEAHYQRLSKIHFPDISGDKESKTHRRNYEYMSFDFNGLPKTAIAPISVSDATISAFRRYHAFLHELKTACEKRTRVKIIMLTSDNAVITALHKLRAAYDVPLFQLPVEAREMIYEHVFHYPKSGIMWQKKGRPALIQSPSSPTADRTFKFEDWDRAISQNHVTEERYWRPLQVSKRIHEEAVAHLFRNSHFHCGSLAALDHLLNFDAPKAHIRSLSFDYDVRKEAMHPAFVNSALSKLREMACLLKLYVRINQDQWRAVGGKSKAKIYDNPSKLPGVNILGSVRGLENVHFVGCPTIANKIEANLCKAKK